MKQDVYKYYTRRPPVPGAIPNSPKPISVSSYDGPVNMGGCTVWGEVLYNAPLDADSVSAYELVADRHNRDVWNELCALADEVGEWEAKMLPEQKRLTWYYSDYGSYVPVDTASIEDFQKRKRIMDLAKKRNVPRQTLLRAL